MDAAQLQLENGGGEHTDRKGLGVEDGEEAEEDLPEDDDAMKTIADNIARKLDEETKDLTLSTEG